jgi:hypothetical protein
MNSAVWVDYEPGRECGCYLRLLEPGSGTTHALARILGGGGAAAGLSLKVTNQDSSILMQYSGTFA